MERTLRGASTHDRAIHRGVSSSPFTSSSRLIPRRTGMTKRKSSPASLLLRRSKESERDGGKWFLEHDGPDEGRMAPGAGIVSRSGRVGHIPELQYDLHSVTYAVENKHVRLNATWQGWWEKIINRAARAGKAPCLRIDPSNRPSVPVMHIITEERHAWLLECERRVKGKGAGTS